MLVFSGHFAPRPTRVPRREHQEQENLKRFKNRKRFGAKRQKVNRPPSPARELHTVRTMRLRPSGWHSHFQYSSRLPIAATAQMLLRLAWRKPEYLLSMWPVRTTRH